MHSVLRKRTELDVDEWQACREAFASIPSGRICSKQELRVALAKLGQHLTDDELQELSKGRDHLDFSDFEEIVETQKRKFLLVSSDKIDASRAFEAMGGAAGSISLERMRQLCHDFSLNCDLEMLAMHDPVTGDPYFSFDTFRQLWEGGLSVPQSRELEFSGTSTSSDLHMPVPPAVPFESGKHHTLRPPGLAPRHHSLHRSAMRVNVITRLKAAARHPDHMATHPPTVNSFSPAPPKAEHSLTEASPSAARTGISRRVVATTGPNRMHRL